jgi:hypothetical protein
VLGVVLLVACGVVVVGCGTVVVTCALVLTGGGGGGGGTYVSVGDGGGGGGASLVGGGTTIGDGSALGGGGGTELGDGSCELSGGGGAVVVLLGSVGARLSLLVKVNATPPIAIIDTSAASPRNSCGRRVPRGAMSNGSAFGSCISCDGVARLSSVS